MALTKLQREYLEHCVVSQETGYTDREFCERVGLPERTAKSWKLGERCPEFPALLEAAKKEYAESHSIFGAKTYLWSLQEMLVNYKAAKKAKETTEARHWLKEITALTKPKDDTGPRVDYSEWAVEDLEAEAFKRGLTPEEEVIEQIRGQL